MNKDIQTNTFQTNLKGGVQDKETTAKAVSQKNGRLIYFSSESKSTLTVANR